MDVFKKDMAFFFLLMVALFIGWVLAGGPAKAVQDGSVQNKFQQPIAPISTGQTYNRGTAPVAADASSASEANVPY